MTDRLTGIILAGGRSSRFGSDKAFAPWNGKPLILHMLEILKPLFPVRLVVAKRAHELRSRSHFDAVIVQDEFINHHPLVGILSGLKSSPTDRNFICACDMPLLRPSLIGALCEASGGYKAAVPVWKGKLQPLCGVYSKGCLPAIEAMINEECLGAADLADRVPTRVFRDGEVAVTDPKGLSFLDIDTLEDYQKARDLSHEHVD